MIQPIKNAIYTLRDLRRINNKSLDEVAKALGVVARTVYYYETGQRRLSLEQVIILAKLYDVSAEEIIEGQLVVCSTD